MTHLRRTDRRQFGVQNLSRRRPGHGSGDHFPDRHAVFLDLCQENTTVRSRVEADVVLELILSLLMRDVSPEDIGVVVSYRAQSQLITLLLTEK